MNLFSLSYMFIKNVYWLLHSSILILVLNRTFEFHRSFNIDVFVRYAVHSKRPSIKLQLFACWNLHILYSRFPNPYVAAIGKIKLLINFTLLRLLSAVVLFHMLVIYVVAYLASVSRFLMSYSYPPLLLTIRGTK